ncbi:MAG TPA: GNAT family N-acetyltransferase [Bacteroidia bacterium]|jgi:GNAT superfamily N-acetyltransferase
MEILPSTDHSLLAALNEEAQTLHHKLYPQLFKPYNKTEASEFFKKTLGDKDAKAFVVFENGQALGYIFLFIKVIPENTFIHAKHFILLDQVSVLEKHRGRGIGKLLIDHAISFARSLHLNRIELNHWSLNEPARNFFNKCGFEYFNEKMAMDLE